MNGSKLKRKDAKAAQNSVSSFCFALFASLRFNWLSSGEEPR
jgi:hypothetical protein